MAQAAAFIGTKILSAIGLSTFAATAQGAIVAEIIGTVVISAASYGISSALTPSRTLPPSVQKQNIRQPVAARRRCYGRMKIGGVIAFLEVRTITNLDGSGTTPHLFSLLMLAAHEIDGIDQYWLGDQFVTLTGGGLVNEIPFNILGVHRAKLVAQLGTDGQTAHADLTSAFPGEWTANHRLRGVANILGIFRGVEDSEENAVFMKAFPLGIPQMRVLARCAKVWDPSPGAAQDPDDPATWTFAMNGPKIVMDYLWHEDGMRLPRELIELALDDWIEKIAVGFELVDLAAGGTEQRYLLSGAYELTSPPRDVLPLMLAPMGATLRMRADSAIVLDLPEYYEPTVVFTQDHIFTYRLRRSPEAGQLRNEIRAKFVYPENGYEEQEAEPWRDEASIALHGLQSTTLDLTWCPSHRQACRRMKLEAYRLNPEWTGSIIVNAYGLDAWGERLIRIQPEAGIDLVCEITGHEFDPTSGRSTISVRSMPEEAFAWDPETEEGTAPVSTTPDPD